MHKTTKREQKDLLICGLPHSRFGLKKKVYEQNIARHGLYKVNELYIIV